MAFGTSKIEKILFHWTPKYNSGVQTINTDEEVVEITMQPANGHPIIILQINYTNEILTLRYKSDWLEIGDERYEGIVYEMYEK